MTVSSVAFRRQIHADDAISPCDPLLGRALETIESRHDPGIVESG